MMTVGAARGHTEARPQAMGPGMELSSVHERHGRALAGSMRGGGAVPWLTPVDHSVTRGAGTQIQHVAPHVLISASRILGSFLAPLTLPLHEFAEDKSDNIKHLTLIQAHN